MPDDSTKRSAGNDFCSFAPAMRAAEALAGSERRRMSQVARRERKGSKHQVRHLADRRPDKHDLRRRQPRIANDPRRPSQQSAMSLQEVESFILPPALFAATEYGREERREAVLPTLQGIWQVHPPRRPRRRLLHDFAKRWIRRCLHAQRAARPDIKPGVQACPQVAAEKGESLQGNSARRTKHLRRHGRWNRLAGGVARAPRCPRQKQTSIARKPELSLKRPFALAKWNTGHDIEDLIIMNAGQGPPVQTPDSWAAAALSLFVSLDGSSLLTLAASCLAFNNRVKAGAARAMTSARYALKPAAQSDLLQSPVDFSRTVIIGTSCAGKSTLAKKLSQTLDAPHVELDALHWLPDWIERPNEELCALAEQALRAEHWVVDGNYRQLRELVWPRATEIVWLNYSFATVFSRAVRRTLMRSLRRETLYSGNRESLRRAFFSRDSILLWVLTSHGRLRREYEAVFNDSQRVPQALIELRRPREAEALVETILSSRQ